MLMKLVKMKREIANIFNFEKSNTNPDKTLMALLPKTPGFIKLRERGRIRRVGDKVSVHGRKHIDTIILS